MSRSDRPPKRRRIEATDSGPYVLRNVLDEIPLRGDSDAADISITCVEYWNGNLYIGTSASELLHLVALPSEDESERPTYILASRLQPSGQNVTPPTGTAVGVQQILVLPGPMRACVVCNGVVSFYTLPELSPAFPSKETTGIQWIGGLDENEGVDNPDGHVTMLAFARRLRLVKIGERLQTFGTVDYPGCLRSCRRETIACVANETSYALLEVEHRQQIPLVPISSASTESSQSQSPAGHHTSSSGHSRSTSLGNPLLQESQIPGSAGTHTLGVPGPGERGGSPQSIDGQRPGSRPRSSTDGSAPVQTRGRYHRLKPHILSPTPTEFMLTTGTTRHETGVGVFFNLDGDPSRGAIEFERYPDDVIIYSFGEEDGMSTERPQFVLALLDKTDLANGEKVVEVQDLSGETPKVSFSLSNDGTDVPSGLNVCLSSQQHVFTEVTELLRAVRFKPRLHFGTLVSDPRTNASIKMLEQEKALFEEHSSQAGSPTMEYEQRRSEEEKKFVARLGQSSTKAMAWSGQGLWHILQTPLLLELENSILAAKVIKDGEYDFQATSVPRVLSLLGSIRDREPQNELEFWTLKYIRQKASLVLLLCLQSSLGRSKDIDSACQIVRNALQEGEIDPRVVLLLAPPLCGEVIQGPNGIWIPAGMVEMLDGFDSPINAFDDAPFSFWLMIRQFLSEWQEKRGYGSITDENYVFDSVDAATLHVLLYLDQALPAGSGVQNSTRSKLNNVVDHWKGDFPRAIALLEHHRRLFVLSRLYQSRKLAKDVLATWKRLAEGERDEDKSLTVEMVETQVRRYLTKISNANLVQEYGLWLAQRNPELAIQVFADGDSRVKFDPANVVAMLKSHAPSAVQDYLEHLVFTKRLDQYADDLIGYYLDSVLNVLETSPAAKDSLEQSYVAYRALESPKPTYLNFITQNTPPQPWWRSRLRLLQLLGSGGYATTSASGGELTYSVDKVLERLTPFSSYLVSESVILDARQGRHKEALRLLTHGLGDYDTAVRYCYFGGPAPTTSQPVDADTLPSRSNQRELFTFLFYEFLRIQDAEECLERTSHLLGNFASWFDPLTIFDAIPQSWTIDKLSEFLLRSFRAATSEKNEAIIIKALSAAQNLQGQATYIEMCEKFGGRVETVSVDAPVQRET